MAIYRVADNARCAIPRLATKNNFEWKPILRFTTEYSNRVILIYLLYRVSRRGIAICQK